MPTVPNYAHVPDRLYKTGLYDLKSPDGQAAFTDAVVSTLNGIDPNFRHLKKKSSQTHVHRHGEDSVIYLLPDDMALAVDFIGGAGGSNPGPAWMVGEYVYKHVDAHDPRDHGIGGGSVAPAPAPAPSYPSYEALGGDEGGKKITRLLEADYKRAKGQLDGECGTWPQRTNYDFLTRICATVEESIAKHQPEWREALNQERSSQGLSRINW